MNSYRGKDVEEVDDYVIDGENMLNDYLMKNKKKVRVD